MVNKVFEKLVINRIADHLAKCSPFSDIQCGFRSSRSTADCLTVLSDRIAWVFNRSEAIRTVALDISKAFDRVWHASLLHKFKSYGVSVEVFGLISSFLSKRWLWKVLDGKSSQKYPVNTGFLKGLFLVLHFSYYTLMTFLITLSVILLSKLMILLSTLNSIRDLISGNNKNWLLKLNLIYETLWSGSGRGWLISMLEKLNWFRLTNLTTLVLLMTKLMGLILRKNHLLRCWVDFLFQIGLGLLHSFSLSVKLPPTKLEPLFVLWSFFLLRLLCISMNLQYDHPWNTVVMFWLVLLVATWNCWLSYQNGYCRLLVYHLLLLLNPWLVVKM